MVNNIWSTLQWSGEHWHLLRHFWSKYRSNTLKKGRAKRRCPSLFLLCYISDEFSPKFPISLSLLSLQSLPVAGPSYIAAMTIRCQRHHLPRCQPTLVATPSPPPSVTAPPSCYKVIVHFFKKKKLAIIFDFLGCMFFYFT